MPDFFSLHALPHPGDDRLPTIRELVDCPDTALAEQLRKRAVEADRSCPAASPHKAFLTRAAARATGLHKWCHRRDLDLERRRALGPAFEHCVCLGQGGRGQEVNVMMRGPDGPLVVFDAEGQGVLSYEEVCSCPDGLALAERVRTAREAATVRARRARVERLAGAAGVPALYRRRTREGWLAAVTEHGGDVAAATQKLGTILAWEEMIADPEPTPRCLLVLLGNYGTGKSTLSALIALGWADRERSVAFRTAPQLAVQFRGASWRRERDDQPPTEGELLAALIEEDLLVLDDLGTEALGNDVQGDRVREWLFTVLDGRLGACRPTVVSTNLTRHQLDERYGARLVSRLINSTQAVQVVFREGIPDLRDDGLRPG